MCSVDFGRNACCRVSTFGQQFTYKNADTAVPASMTQVHVLLQLNTVNKIPFLPFGALGSWLRESWYLLLISRHTGNACKSWEFQNHTSYIYNTTPEDEGIQIFRRKQRNRKRQIFLHTVYVVIFSEISALLRINVIMYSTRPA